MNLWIDFLINRLFTDSDIVEKLLKLDCSISGKKYDIDKLYAFLNKNKKKSKFYNIKEDSDLEIFIEGNPETIIKICNDLPGKSGIMVIEQSYININKWITKQYITFCLENEYGSFVVPLYGDKFGNDLNNIIAIGSELFVNDIKKELDKIYQSYIE